MFVVAALKSLSAYLTYKSALSRVKVALICPQYLEDLPISSYTWYFLMKAGHLDNISTTLGYVVFFHLDVQPLVSLTDFYSHFIFQSGTPVVHPLCGLVSTFRWAEVVPLTPRPRGAHPLWAEPCVGCGHRLSCSLS